MSRRLAVQELPLLAALALVVTCLGGSAAGQGDRLGPAAAGQDAAHAYFTDVVLVDQDGKRHRLYSDLIAGKVVVVNSFFTTCEGVCPMMAKSLAEIQSYLGDRLGKDVYMLSISVDAANDTPPRVKEFSRRYEARPGWFFLTGDQQNVDFALRKLGQYAEQKEAHTNVIVIGNERTGLWKKAFGMAPVDQLLPIVRSVVEDKG